VRGTPDGQAANGERRRDRAFSLLINRLLLIMGTRGKIVGAGR
jgi:hypothetical protein